MKSKFWMCLRYATIGLFALCAVLSMFEGEWYQAFLQGMIAVLFVIVTVNERLLESTLAGWREAIDGWRDSNEQLFTLIQEIQDTQVGEPYDLEGTYEPYGFSKRDMN